MKDKDETKEQLISELNRCEKEINKRQQEFANLFRNGPEALVYIDEKSNILNINPALLSCFCRYPYNRWLVNYEYLSIFTFFYIFGLLLLISFFAMERSKIPT